MNNPMNMIKQGFGLDAIRIAERFKRGRLGEAFEKVVMTDEVQDYFTTNLVMWAKAELDTMTPLARKEFENMVTPELLWQNFSANFVMNAFVNSLKRWLGKEDEVFDELAIAFATVENAKRVIDALQATFKDLAREIQARNIDGVEWPPSSPFGKNKKGTQFYS